jgi:hypothetical protein
VDITGESAYFNTCVLRLQRCNAEKPCPLHNRAQHLRSEWQDLFASTCVKDLLKEEQVGFLESLSLS